ncbi:MAG TPA: hypothetical protein PLP71_10620 [Syntrophomonadaceae bacterium]|nr:hypothetical protein [Syntrophomonadaceae bacterium]
MPIDTKIGKPKQESKAMSLAKGKINKSYANTLFETVNDFFYEFGIIGKPAPEKEKKEKKEE